tara:strand:- start:7664 stop:7837 length:174 start_codon:yes stop_codon:yes gene_type:complete
MKATEAINFFGSKSKLADALGIDRSAVTLWGAKIPLGRQYQIQVLTNGKLKADPQAA